jgi:hypothetical protein
MSLLQHPRSRSRQSFDQRDQIDSLLHDRHRQEHPHGWNNCLDGQHDPLRDFMVDFPALVSCGAKGQSNVVSSHFGAPQRFDIRVRNRIRINEFKNRHWSWSQARVAHHRNRVSHTPKITSVHGLEYGYRSLSARILSALITSKQALQHFIKIIELAHEVARFAAKFGQAATAGAAIEGICSQPLQRSLLGMTASRARDLHRSHRSTSLAARSPLKRGEILQSLLNIGTLVFCLLFIAITAGSIVWAFFTLLFVRT